MTLSTMSTEIQWEESALAETRTMPCPCGVEVPFSASRRCGGSFETGVFWEEVESECVYSDVTDMLCELPDVRI